MYKYQYYVSRCTMYMYMYVIWCHCDVQLMSSGVCLSPLSRERLPFHPLVFGKPWKIISEFRLTVSLCEIHRPAVMRMFVVQWRHEGVCVFRRWVECGHSGSLDSNSQRLKGTCSRLVYLVTHSLVIFGLSTAGNYMYKMSCIMNSNR